MIPYSIDQLQRAAYAVVQAEPKAVITRAGLTVTVQLSRGDAWSGVVVTCDNEAQATAFEASLKEQRDYEPA